MALTDTTNSTASTRADLEKKTVPELKTLCKAAGCPMTGAKGVLVGYLLDPANNQKGKRKAAGGASGGQSKAAKAARAMAGPWSATEEPGVDPAQAEASLRRFVNSCASHVDARGASVPMRARAASFRRLDARRFASARPPPRSRRNWHDCYESTGLLLHKYMEDCLERAEACIAVARKGEGYDLCHRTLCAVADTWDDMQAIPFRGCPREDISNGDFGSIGVGEGQFSTDDPEELATFALPLVLALAAADDRVADGALQRMLKDCVDHGCNDPHEASESERGLDFEPPAKVAEGRERLAGIFADTASWANLPSWKPKHKMRRAIDRRFDGPKHLRTRGSFGFGDY